MVLVKYDYCVPAVALGDIRGRDAMLAPYASELVGRCTVLGMAKIASFPVFHLALDINAKGWGLVWTSGAQGIE
jgi:hypothetical protein